MKHLIIITALLVTIRITISNTINYLDNDKWQYHLDHILLIDKIFTKLINTQINAINQQDMNVLLKEELAFPLKYNDYEFNQFTLSIAIPCCNQLFDIHCTCSKILTFKEYTIKKNSSQSTVDINLNHMQINIDNIHITVNIYNNLQNIHDEDDYDEIHHIKSCLKSIYSIHYNKANKNLFKAYLLILYLSFDNYKIPRNYFVDTLFNDIKEDHNDDFELIELMMKKVFSERDQMPFCLKFFVKSLFVSPKSFKDISESILEQTNQKRFHPYLRKAGTRLLEFSKINTYQLNKRNLQDMTELFVSTSSSTSPSLLIIHGIIFFFLWGLITPLSIILVRFFKHMDGWIDYHRQLSQLVSSITIPSATAMITINNVNGQISFDNSSHSNHKIIGLISAILCFIVMATGNATDYLRINSITTYRYLIIMKYIHRIAALSCYILCELNILGGTILMVQQTSPLMFSLYTFMVIKVLIFFILLFESKFQLIQKIFGKVRINIEEKVNNNPSSHKPQFNVKLFKEFVNSGKKWVVLDKNIYNIKKFIKIHPGGSEILNTIIGQDIGKFYYGFTSIYKSVPLHLHSKAADKVLKDYIVATLRADELDYHFKEQKSPGFTLIYGLTNTIKDRWYIVEKENLSNSIIKLRFRNDQFQRFYNPFEISTFGRHYGIKATIKSNTIFRYYTDLSSYIFFDSLYKAKNKKTMMIQPLDIGEEITEINSNLHLSPRHTKLDLSIAKTELQEENQEHNENKENARHIDIKALKSYKSQELNPSQENYQKKSSSITKSIIENIFSAEKKALLQDFYTNTIKNDNILNGDILLIIKVYPNGLMTNYLNNLKINDTVEIEGPHGLGLGLTKDDQGVKVGFAAGTGILPFLGLLFLYYLKLRAIYRLMKKKKCNNEQSNCKDVPLHYGDILKFEQFIIFCSFKTYQDAKALGLDLMLEIIKLVTILGTDEIKIFITISNSKNEKNNLWTGMTGRFTTDFIFNNLPKELNQVFVCGPSVFHQDIANMMHNLGFPLKNIIHI